MDGGDESEGLLFTGSEGTMEIGWNQLTVSRSPREKEPGHTIGHLHRRHAKTHYDGVPAEVSTSSSDGSPICGIRKVRAPKGYSDSYDHFKNFFAAVRSRQPVVEDAVFGYRAAGAALLSNLSVEREAVMKWDPEAMKLVS